MKPISGGILASFFLFVSFHRASDSPATLSVRDFFKYPERCAYRLSPNGEWISYLKPTGESRRLNIFVRRAYSNEVDEKCITSETSRDILTYFWKGDNRLIYLLDPNRDEDSHIYSVDDLQRPRVTDLTALQKLRIKEIVDPLDGFDDELLVRSESADRDASNIYRVNLIQGITDGSMTLAAKHPGRESHGDIKRWIADEQGSVRAAIAVEHSSINLLIADQSTFHLVQTWNFRNSIDRDEQLHIFRAGYHRTISGIEEPQLHFARYVSSTALRRPGAGIPEQVIYALSNADRGTKALVMIDLKTGNEIGQPLYKNQTFDANGMEIFNGQVTCATYLSTRRERDCWGEPKPIYQTIIEERKLPPEVDVLITSRDRAEKRFIVVISSDQNPGQFYLFDTKKEANRWTLLSEFAPQLQGKLAPMHSIHYTSRDKKFEIYGYLTLPVGYDGIERIPLVVLPHGGPWWRDIWGYTRENTETQFFAARGYAVLQVNFRGSVGYGNQFWEAGFKQWGADMQDDITDGILWAINDGKIDPKRVAIVGESYGGYAALAGITFTRDFQYAAAVDRAGISDLVLLMAGFPEDDQLKQMIGDPDPEKDRDLLAKRSPALHAEQITAPLLVAHGINDPIVEPCQSDKIVAVLCSHHANVEYLRFDEGHIFLNEENRIAYYQAVDAFLKKYLQKKTVKD